MEAANQNIPYKTHAEIVKEYSILLSSPLYHSPSSSEHLIDRFAKNLLLKEVMICRAILAISERWAIRPSEFGDLRFIYLIVPAILSFIYAILHSLQE